MPAHADVNIYNGNRATAAWDIPGGQFSVWVYDAGYGYGYPYTDVEVRDGNQTCWSYFYPTSPGGWNVDPTGTMATLDASVSCYSQYGYRQTSLHVEWTGAGVPNVNPQPAFNTGGQGNGSGVIVSGTAGVGVDTARTATATATFDGRTFGVTTRATLASRRGAGVGVHL